MNILMCPVCGNELELCLNSYKCKNNHSFDISRKGYVNLLMSNASKEKRHGDDKAMVEARKDFLNRGYYLPLAQEISKNALQSNEKSPIVFECGCGDCYYLNEVKNEMIKCGKTPKIYGGDISKEVLPYGKKRMDDVTLFAASAVKLPIRDNSVDIAMSIFAPMDMNELGRIVKKDGLLIKVIPLEEHLLELKQALYENVYLNRPVVEENENFRKESFLKLQYKFTLNNQTEIDELFKMTPYYYKTSAEAQNRLLSMNSMSITASFGIIKYRRL